MDILNVFIVSLVLVILKLFVSLVVFVVYCFILLFVDLLWIVGLRLKIFK